LGFTGIEFSTTKAAKGNKTETTDLLAINNDTITLKMTKNNDIYDQFNNYSNNNVEIIYQDDKKKLSSTDVFINVEKSETDQAYLQIRKYSEGRNKLKASQNAEKISYNYTIKNNEILLDRYFISEYKNAFKNEDVYIKLFIPNNVTVHFDNSTKNFLRSVENTTDTYDKDMAKHYFVMTDDGLHSNVLKALEELDGVDDVK